MKMRLVSAPVLGLCVASLVLVLCAAAQDAAVPAAPATTNVIKKADCEFYSVGRVGQEADNVFWAPVAKELKLENTYFRYSTDKAHGGNKSIRIELTPETSQKWLANPGKPGFDNLWLHYTTKNKKALSLLAAEKVVFSVWVYVEKGTFTAKVLCRVHAVEGAEPIIDGVIQPDKTGEWVECRLEGQGVAGVTWADVRFDIECPGDFVVYLDDFYYGPEK